MGPNHVLFHRARILLIFCFTLIWLISVVLADCECGYSIGSEKTEDYTVFTDVLESDFTKLKNIYHDTDWVPQEWKVGKVQSRGPYGRQTLLANVISNPLKNRNSKKSSIGKNGNEAGLELWVRKLEQPEQEYVTVAELDSYRTDIFYGSFRAGIQITPVKGTCGAFFWYVNPNIHTVDTHSCTRYLNDTQEIDMEFLSSRMNETNSPIHLVLHSTLSFQEGGDASNTPSYKVIDLPFQPSDGVHEYRFDWTPGSVKFYADGALLAEMNDTNYVPSVPGKIILSHWSNGQELWSGGPPEEDAKMLVQYVKGYFNTTASARAEAYHQRCFDPAAMNAVCEIPNIKGKPVFGETYFFSQDPSKNKTNGQIIHALSPAAASFSSNHALAYMSSMATAFFVLWIL
ncbi:concanavalin A-like lectin/glucanase [Ascodesmis nigricans]|uniref:Concanavalin A-like lectin/glucanase n=1 Tax=Ascodesmis nigricans TaxID=341454 RepID=A0A4S2N6N7_9PEZI|nr:concanavalin A-like lectin/glucanase [Ascodesmis nigricans]